MRRFVIGISVKTGRRGGASSLARCTAQSYPRRRWLVSIHSI
jgi:hypothetical protein